VDSTQRQQDDEDAEDLSTLQLGATMKTVTMSKAREFVPMTVIRACNVAVAR
jgi:hypothetical protein